MDSAFSLPREARGRFLQSAARAIGCSYIFLWSYQPHPSHCLVSLDGWLEDEDGAQRSPASVRWLFDEYRKSVCVVDTGCVPGFAYREGRPYLELHGLDLMSVASSPVQRQFYQEAGIKTAVFMGCKSGEIEVGIPISGTKFDVKMDIMRFFTDDIAQSFGPATDPSSRPSSSCSSMPSFSTSSPECSSFLLNTPTTSGMPPELLLQEDSRPVHHAIHPHPTVYSKTAPPMSRLREGQLPTQTSNADETMMRAMLAVLSSSPSSSSSPPVGNSPPAAPTKIHKGIAFRRYSGANFVNKRKSMGSQSMIKAMHSVLRNIESVKAAQGTSMELAKPTSNQLHHMISERKRREKLNESFQALRALLPPGTKRDKASVLAIAKDYLTNLKSRISDLEAKNRVFETPLSPATTDDDNLEVANEGARIELVEVSRSSSGIRRIDLKVTMVGECEILDMALNILLCIKQMGGIDIAFMESSGHSRSTKRANLTLHIKGSEWDEEAFREAIRRALRDVARPSTSLP